MRSIGATRVLVMQAEKPPIKKFWWKGRLSRVIWGLRRAPGFFMSTSAFFVSFLMDSRTLRALFSIICLTIFVLGIKYCVKVNLQEIFGILG
jgi:hypothetical protein